MLKQITITIEKNNLIMITAIIIFSTSFLFYFFSKASFIEPTVDPASSSQDFAQNIIGANNADNDFSSQFTTANNDGSIIERLEYFTDYMQTRDRREYVYGRGWVASSSGDSSVALTQKACEDAVGWEWFEDGNGDGDTIDPEDGICVKTGVVIALSYNGKDSTAMMSSDNTYLAGYTCTGSYPTGTVATYNGIDSSGVADTTWNAGDCALCEADCYDGRKDLPDQIGQDGDAYLAGSTSILEGPINPEILKNWKGTKLPTVKDYFGFCGATSGDTDTTVGDGNYYASGASTNKTIGNYGHNVGSGGEYIDLSNIGFSEWLAEIPGSGSSPLVAYSGACSRLNTSMVYTNNRFRAVFRP